MAKDELRLRKMRRSQLIEIIYALQENNQKLKAKIQSQDAMLSQRHLAMNNAGSIAEASLQLSGIFESAQKAADQYLLSISKGYGATPQSLHAMQQANASYTQHQTNLQHDARQAAQQPTKEITEEVRRQLAEELRGDVEQQIAIEAKAEMRQQLELVTEEARRKQDEQANQVIYAYATKAQEKAIEVIEAAKDEAAQYAIKVVELTKRRAIDEYAAIVGNAAADADTEASAIIANAEEKARQIIEDARLEAEQEAMRIVENACKKAQELLSASPQAALPSTPAEAAQATSTETAAAQPFNNETALQETHANGASETQPKTTVRKRRRKTSSGKSKSSESPSKHPHSTHSTGGNGAVDKVSSNIVLPDETIAGKTEKKQGNKTGARRKTPRRKPSYEASGEHAAQKDTGKKPTVQIVLEDSDKESIEHDARRKSRSKANTGNRPNRSTRPSKPARQAKPRSSKHTGNSKRK